jgi:hypothetical protein
MEPFRDDQLIADLRAQRPTPRPRFAAELDERAAAGFPRRSPTGPWDEFRAWLGSLSPRQMLIPAAGVAAMVIAVATAALVLGQGGSGSSETQIAVSRPAPRPDRGASNFDGSVRHAPSQTTLGSSSGKAEPQVSGSVVLPEGATAAVESGSASGAAAQAPESTSNFRPGVHHRAVERAAEITLAADPKDVDDDASRVFEAVHANNGIVMRSSTEEGRPGEAGATFELLIPSARLDDAMAAFSEIDAVRSRHESTADITAPTVSAAELLKESRARIDSLLAQLGTAESEEEQEAIEAELRHERRHASRIAAQLTHLHKRADFSRVSLRIETGGKESSGGGGAWGVDDALGDAGHVLTVAAAVTLIALAILGPIALIALLAWLTHRAWVRRERRRVLS